MKICSKCKVAKQESEFHKDSSKASGLSPSCKTCRNVIVKEWSLNNKDRRAATNRALYRRNKKEILSKNLAWQRKNPEKASGYSRAWGYKKQYGDQWKTKALIQDIKKGRFDEKTRTIAGPNKPINRPAAVGDTTRSKKQEA